MYDLSKLNGELSYNKNEITKVAGEFYSELCHLNDQLKNEVRLFNLEIPRETESMKRRKSTGENN